MLSLVAGGPRQGAAVLAVSVAAWAFLTWIAVDMGHPLVQLTMPGSPSWSVASVLIVAGVGKLLALTAFVA